MNKFTKKKTKEDKEIKSDSTIKPENLRVRLIVEQGDLNLGLGFIFREEELTTDYFTKYVQECLVEPMRVYLKDKKVLS